LADWRNVWNHLGFERREKVRIFMDRHFQTNVEKQQKQGCQIFLGTRYPSRKKCTKKTQKVPNGHKISPHFPIKGPPKFTQIGIFGLKINHLATLSRRHKT
jgi:hypothetical protein